MTIIPIDDPLSREVGEVIRTIRKQNKDMLLTLIHEGNANALQAFILVMCEMDEEQVRKIPVSALRCVGSLANLAMLELAVEAAKDKQASNN